MYRGALICLVAIAFVAGPMAKFGFCEQYRTKNGNPSITAVPPKMLASAEEQLPKAKKSTGKYILMGVLGAALVALAAGGGGGGGSSSPPADSGEVEVSW